MCVRGREEDDRKYDALSDRTGKSAGQEVYGILAGPGSWTLDAGSRWINPEQTSGTVDGKVEGNNLLLLICM